MMSLVRAQLEEPKETNTFYNIVIMMFVSFSMQFNIKGEYELAELLRKI